MRPPVDPMRGGRRVALSNLDKVLWPRSGLTKGWLVDHDAAMAPVLLPHLAGHPLTLHRFPDGVAGPHWYETRAPARPGWVRTVTFHMRRTGKVFDVGVGPPRRGDVAHGDRGPAREGVRGLEPERRRQVDGRPVLAAGAGGADGVHAGDVGGGDAVAGGGDPRTLVLLPDDARRRAAAGDLFERRC